MTKLGFLILAILVAGCGECDNSKYYQIKVKNPDEATPGICHYLADGLGPCASWQKTQQIAFTDSCHRFPLSQIITRAEINKLK